jgi:flavin-dependent dehydrogenase
MSQRIYDTIIVGARCAGSATAMLLARKGYRVLLLDRITFPSDTMSTHWIQQSGVAQLERWGVLEQVRATGCPPIERVTFDFGEFAISGCAPPADGISEALAPRRYLLDQILLEAAVKAGVEFREGVAVEELIWDDGSVTGVRGRHAGSKVLSEHGRIVIGADGIHSRIARLVEAPAYREVSSLTSFYYSYWSGIEAEGIEMYPRPGCGVGLIPTNDGLTLAGAVRSRGEFKEFRADIEGTFLRTCEVVPGLAERVEAGRREERFLGTGEQPNYFRRPYGAGWALVGDAAYNKDPITAQGISDAFRDAELLADAIDSGFSVQEPLEEALASYQRRRDESVLPMYEMTVDMAKLAAPPPEQAAVFAAIAADQDASDRFLGMFAGTVSIPEFMSEDNLARIMGSTTSTAAA